MIEHDDDDDVSVAILVHKKVTGSFAPDSQTDAGTMSKVAGNSAFIYLGERSGKERTLLVANSCGAPQPAVARDDVALLALKDGPDEKTQGSAGDVEEPRLLLLQAAPSNASR